MQCALQCVLECAAVCCRVLKCVTVCVAVCGAMFVVQRALIWCQTTPLKHPSSQTCNAATLHCNTLQHTATHCSTLQHTATHCNIVRPRFSIHPMPTVNSHMHHCGTLQHCNTLQQCHCNSHCNSHCNTLQHHAYRIFSFDTTPTVISHV